MGEIIDIKGRRFGFLTVLEYKPSATMGGAMWKCRCDCGKELLVLGTTLRSGKKKSCGCRGKGKKTEIYCEYCGEPVLTDGCRYCSPSCAGKARFNVKPVKVDMSHKWEQAEGGFWKCRYQAHVRCADRDCARCGWNPEVAAARSAAILEKMGVRNGEDA